MSKSEIKSITDKELTKDRFLIFLLLITILIYLKGMSSELLNFDDNEYFENYPEVLKFNLKNIVKYFTNYYVLMYQPIPILSFALTYSFIQLDPVVHHCINLGLHLFNIYLVYVFISKLSDKLLIIRTVTFLFALHPLAVEAVMWFSCRSSGLYVAFFLLGLIAYYNFRKTSHSKYYWMAMLWFLLSLFSKAQAVTFPLALLLIDWYYFNIKLNKNLIINKIPFFILSMIFGVITLLNKDTVNNITYGSVNYELVDYFFLLNYEILWYFIKVIVPSGLAPIYVYPPKVDGLLPIVYYVSPIGIGLLLFLIYKTAKSKPYVLFGTLFCLFILSVSLQILPSRQVIVADRYGYLPNIGLFFIFGSLLHDWIEGKINFFNSFKLKMYLVNLFSVILIFITFQQIDIWKNDSTLAERIIKENPPTDYIARAYGIKGNYNFSKKGDYETALADYTNALNLDSTDWFASYQCGLIYKLKNDYPKSIYYLEKAHVTNPLSSWPLADIGVIHLEIKNYDLALKFADSAINVERNSAKSLNLKAACLLNLGKAAESEQFFSKAIQSNPNYVEAIKNRGIVRLNYLNNKTGACEDFNLAYQLGAPGMDQIIAQYCK